MSESFIPNEEDQPQVLDVVSAPESNREVRFVIGPHAKGKDVLATLHYLSADEENVQRDVERILDLGIKGGRLDNDTVVLKSRSKKLTGQVAVQPNISFGEEPTLDDLSVALAYVYGEENLPRAKTEFLETVVDRGNYHDFIYQTRGNEITNAEPDQIAQEMANLTRQFGSQDRTQ